MILNSLIAFTLVVLAMIMSTSALDVQWSSCPLHSGFQMPEGVKYFPKTSIPMGAYAQIAPFVDALNELNMKKNEVYRTTAECAMVSTVLNHNDDKSQPMKLFVKRLRADPTKQAPRALWLLNGGPAMASDTFELPMDVLIKMLGGQFDIYTTDHRGTGRSNRTTCAKAETKESDEGFSISMKEWTKYGCAQAMNDELKGKSQYLSSKEAAIDVVKLIQSINVPQNQKTFVYGVSYGTVWASRMVRYLQLTNQSNLISGYIMDGIVNVIGKPVIMNNANKSGRLVLNVWDENFNAVGNSFMELCGGSKERFATNQFINANSDNTLNKKVYNQKTECAIKLEKKSNGNPVAFMKKVIDNVYSKNTCAAFAENMPLLQLKLMFQVFLMQNVLRPLIPAFVYRLDRCDTKVDIPVLFRIAQVAASMFSTQPTSIPLASEVLKYHIIFSELWDNSTTIQEMMGEYTNPDVLFAGFGIGMKSILDASEWPVYNLDPDYLEQVFETNIPILMINGNLDPNTPLYSALAQQAAIKSNSHNLVIIPFAPHASITGSGYGNSSIPAALQVMVNFIGMETPNAFTVDTSCLDSIKFDTSGDSYFNEKMFGIRNIYEDFYATEVSAHVSSANSNISSIREFLLVVCMMIIVFVTSN